MVTAYCITGFPGSGKSEVARIAGKTNIDKISMGDIVVSHAEEELSNPDSSAISEWATEAREGDKAIFAKRTIDRIDPQKDDIVIDGIRSPSEKKAFEDYFDEVVIVAVTASFENRAERLTKRGRRNEDIDTLKQRMQNESDWGVEKLVQNADITIKNNGTVESLQQKVEQKI